MLHIGEILLVGFKVHCYLATRPEVESLEVTALYIGILNVWYHVKNRFRSGYEGDGGVAGEGRVVGVPKFHSWGNCTINKYQLRLDVQRFLWHVYYINCLYYMGPLSCILGCNMWYSYRQESSKIQPCSWELSLSSCSSRLWKRTTQALCQV